MTDPDRLGTVLTGEDGTLSLRFERALAHPPERVWRALTDPEEIARWFTLAKLEPEAGGRVHLDFGSQGEALGEITVWDPPRVLEHSWVWEGRTSLVRWELTPTAEGTLLVLSHSGLDRDGAADYGAGWQVFVERLPLHLDGQDPTAVPDRYEELLERYRALV